jgi:hypothetical protein
MDNSWQLKCSFRILDHVSPTFPWIVARFDCQRARVHWELLPSWHSTPVTTWASTGKPWKIQWFCFALSQRAIILRQKNPSHCTHTHMRALSLSFVSSLSPSPSLSLSVYIYVCVGVIYSCVCILYNYIHIIYNYIYSCIHIYIIYIYIIQLHIHIFISLRYLFIFVHTMFNLSTFI